MTDGRNVHIAGNAQGSIIVTGDHNFVLPAGLLPGLLDLDSGLADGFSAYLRGDKLPYYSRAEHLEGADAEDALVVETENALLDRLAHGEERGLVVSGDGGTGKTRLTLELGRMAARAGWLVRRVTNSFMPERLAELSLQVAQVAKDAQVLLVIDYAETYPHFPRLCEAVNEFNQADACSLRYVASCRTSYWPALESLSGIHRVDLSGESDPALAKWYAKYRRATVLRILSESGFSSGEVDLEGAEDLPIFAVFLLYLADRWSTVQPSASVDRAELGQLRGMKDFARWVGKRVQLSHLADTGISKDLAFLVGLLPLPNDSVGALDATSEVEIFARLAEDGWIEQRCHSETDSGQAVWDAAHDVLADQMLLLYLERWSRTVDHQLGLFLERAVQLESVRSALVTLQRVSGRPAVQEVDWCGVLWSSLSRHASSWRAARDLLLRTPLLSHAQQIRMLDAHPEVWVDAEESIDFQNALGWLARWVVKEKPQDLSDEEHRILVDWVRRTAFFVSKSNVLLTWGLRLAPEAVRDAARIWIDCYPRQPRTRSALAAWLDTGLPPNEIAQPVEIWLKQHAVLPEAQFVYKAWLDATTDGALVEEPIKAWLAVPENRNAPEASFVYKAWLDATTDGALVEEPIKAWLAVPENRTAPEAGFVYKAWLDATGQAWQLPAIDESLGQVAFEERNWSVAWEQHWRAQPRHPRLVELGRRWLWAAPVGQGAWTWVWEPLFLAFPDDEDFVDVALDWLEKKGPKKRGSWCRVWKVLWDSSRARPDVTRIGLSWIEEYSVRPHKYWWDVYFRLWFRDVESDRLWDLAGRRIRENPDRQPACEI